MLLKTLGPIALLAVIWCRPLALHMRLALLTARFVDEDPDAGGASLVAALRHRIKHIVSQTTAWTLLALDLILPSVTTTIADTFSCERFDTGDFLLAQLSLACDDSPYRRRWEIYGAVY